MVALRDATTEDARGIAAVHVASWRVAYRGLLPDAVLDELSVDARARSWSDRLAALPPRCRTVLVVEGATVLGFATTGPAHDAGDELGAGELYAIYLDPAVWDRGHGARLHAGALANLRDEGFTHACVWFLDGNLRAQRFYLRQGWTETGDTKTDRDLGGGVLLLEHRLRRPVPPA